jgi:hypothetical protein
MTPIPGPSFVALFTMARLARMVVAGLSTSRNAACQSPGANLLRRRRPGYLSRSAGRADAQGRGRGVGRTVSCPTMFTSFSDRRERMVSGWPSEKRIGAIPISLTRARWTGHLFQSRFASVAMDDLHLLAAVSYVSLNPVRPVDPVCGGLGIIQRTSSFGWER